MKLTNKTKALALSAAVLCGLAVSAAHATNPNYAAGDLVLYFEQFGGGSTVMLDLGAAYNFRNLTSNQINIQNVGSDLSSAFGANWFNDSTVFWGAAGVRSSGIGTTTQVNGDPNRTLYISQNRSAIGTEGSASSSGWGPFADGNMTTASSGILGQNNRLGTIPASATDRLTESTTASNVDNQNPFNIAGNPTTAFGIFPGGVMSSFSAGTLGTLGGVAAESALDLYRVLASTSASGQVGGTLRTGDFQGSFVVDNGGNVSFIVAPVAVPEPTTMGATLVLGCVAGAMRRRRRETAQS